MGCNRGWSEPGRIIEIINKIATMETTTAKKMLIDLSKLTDGEII